MSVYAFTPSGPRCRVAAVVLNYCTPELTLKAAESVARDLDQEFDRVLVVDNKSPDDSVAKLREGLAQLELPHVSLIESDRNGGFAAGNNVGIRAANADAYLLLNSDTVVRRGTVNVLRETLSADDTYGLCSPRLQFEDDTPQISVFRQHSPWSELLEGAQTGPLSKLLDHWEVPLGVQKQPISVPWTSFACVLIRRAVLETVGLLDEGFFMYYEDADYCRMAREAGFRIVHDPRGRVVHLRGQSSPVKEATLQRKARPAYYYNARNRFYQRAYGPWGAIAANTLWTVGHGIARFRARVGERVAHSVENELRDNWSTSLPAQPSWGGALDVVQTVKGALEPGWDGSSTEEIDELPHRGSRPPLPAGRLPDFYIIGSMKCATSSLHSQLARRSKFFMSTPKEPNFFCNDDDYLERFDAYVNLFRAASETQLIGESSTHYTKLPSYRDTASRIARHTPEAKLIYVMRDPMERMASQYIHEWTEGMIRCSFSEAVETYPRYLAYSSYARQLRPYLERFDQSQILPVFFEKLVASPEQELERIARFLGDDSEEPFVWHREASRTNVSSERLRESWLRQTVLRFGPARMFKDALPSDLRESIKSIWRMEARPELSSEVRRFAVEALDRDLEDLSSWFGINLTTETFADTARDRSPEWTGLIEAAAE